MDDIKKAVEASLNSFDEPNSRFRSDEVNADGSQYVFITAHPTRGRAIWCIYGFEQVTTNTWRYRFFAPFTEKDSAGVSFVAEGSSVNVLTDGEIAMRISSLK